MRRARARENGARKTETHETRAEHDERMLALLRDDDAQLFNTHCGAYEDGA